MPSVKRNFSAIVAAAVLIATPAFADQCQPKDPQKVAQATVEKLLSELDSHRAEYQQNPEALYQMIERVLVPKFDTDYMARLVLGRYSRTATPEQLQRFTQAFKQMIIQTYGNALFGFHEGQLEFQPVRAPEGATDITFQAEVTTERGKKIPVRMNLHLVDCKWKIYDASVGNLSFITTFRGQFNAMIQAAGLEAVIQQLEKRYAGGLSDPAQ
ncbi:MAG: ABC transporter substrate-binding protein [Salinisphaera sp.]|nr:ABC transporter substrate-binding protein [Salinisphaera sp.]